MAGFVCGKHGVGSVTPEGVSPSRLEARGPGDVTSQLVRRPGQDDAGLPESLGTSLPAGTNHLSAPFINMYGEAHMDSTSFGG